MFLNVTWRQGQSGQVSVTLSRVIMILSVLKQRLQGWKFFFYLLLLYRMGGGPREEITPDRVPFLKEPIQTNVQKC